MEPIAHRDKRRHALAMQLLVNIDVDDLARAERFYTAAFGLRVGRRMGPDFVELLGAPVAIYLLEKAAGTEVAAGGAKGGARDYGRHWTPVHLDFVVPDVEAALARAEAAGAVRESEIGDHAYGRLVMLADPFGHGVCLLEFNSRGYDAIATG